MVTHQFFSLFGTELQPVSRLCVSVLKLLPTHESLRSIGCRDGTTTPLQLSHEIIVILYYLRQSRTQKKSPGRGPCGGFCMPVCVCACVLGGLRSSWPHQLTVFQRVDELSVLAGEDGSGQVEHHTHRRQQHEEGDLGGQQRSVRMLHPVVQLTRR